MTPTSSVERPPHRARVSAAAGYAIALVLALGTLVDLQPPGHLAGRGGEFAWPSSDLATYVAGAYAYVDDAWRFPIFETRRLRHPSGANIIFTDSAPLAGLVAKIAARVTGTRFNYLGTWFAVVWLGQALAAVFLVRQMGVRGTAWSLVAAVLGLCTPAFLARHGHAALSAHFWVLLALGLYARTARAGPSRGTWIAWLAVLGGSLWIHAYLALEVWAVFAAALVDAWRLGKSPLRQLAGVAVLAGGISIALALVGGYAGYRAFSDDGGFGLYSMNVLSPFVPQRSALFGGTTIDATGGQYEGLNYLGLGGLALVALALAAAPRSVWELVRRHLGLVAACVALTALAVSSQVFVGHHELVAFQVPPWRLFSAIRSSGRFFWPVGYALVFSALAVLARRTRPRWGAGALAAGIALTAVQAVDVRLYWEELRGQLRGGDPPGALERSLRRLAGAHERVLVFPDEQCVSNLEQHSRVSRIAFYAAEAGRLVNNAYLARYPEPADCDGDRQRLARLRLRPGELLVAVSPAAEAAAPATAPDGSCRSAHGVTACSLSPELLAASWPAEGEQEPSPAE